MQNEPMQKNKVPREGASHSGPSISLGELFLTFFKNRGNYVKQEYLYYTHGV